MRRRNQSVRKDYRILIVDDEIGIIDSLSVVLGKRGYQCAGITNPLEAIERIEQERFDLLILDYLMQPMHGDKVVERVRSFNQELYILLLTGHKDLAPPLETIERLDIQGYCEKSDRFDQLLLLVESGIKSVAQMRLIQKYTDGLSRILACMPRVFTLQPIGTILEGILDNMMPFVDSRDAFILVDENSMDIEKIIFRGRGRFDLPIETFVEQLEPKILETIGRVRETQQTVALAHGVVLPITNGDSRVVGVIYIMCDTESEGVQFLEIFMMQAASSIQNAVLHSLVNDKNEELKHTYEQLRIYYMDTIEALRQAVDAKDVYTRGHSDRVSHYSRLIGTRLGLPESQLELLKIAGVFHDVGKIGTSDDILLKVGRLSPQEYAEIKKHPLKGAHILSAVSMFTEVVPIVKAHHERIDGSGYPNGLKGGEIPYLARIVAVADAFDAMLSDRIYRDRLKLADAKAQLIKGAGTQFDAGIVEVFLTLLEESGFVQPAVGIPYE